MTFWGVILLFTPTSLAVDILIMTSYTLYYSRVHKCGVKPAIGADFSTINLNFPQYLIFSGLTASRPAPTVLFFENENMVSPPIKYIYKKQYSIIMIFCNCSDYHDIMVNI